VKRTFAVLLITAFLLLVLLPAALPTGVSAQSSGYTIDKVDHQIQIMYSGHVVILDTIHVSGQITDGFMIGLPYQYSADVLEGFAYDANHVYQLNLGVQLGEHSGFYGATVDFNGNTPSVFTVAFVLSNQLITEQGNGVDVLSFPAYPSLARDVGICNVTIAFPSTPISFTINKDDGATSDQIYTRTNLPAYTYAPATATFQVTSGTLTLVTITNLNRQITIDPSGKVTASDTYRIINNSTSPLSSFILTLPLEATNVNVMDQFGNLQGTVSSYPSQNMILANATLQTRLSTGETVVLTAEYNLPSAKLQGSNYVLADSNLFPNFGYYVNQATITFTPPQGATIVSPKTSELDSSSTLTRNTYQDTLAITKDGLSYVSYLEPQQSTLQLSFNYNPVWVSFLPTFWATILAVAICIGVFYVRTRKPKEETHSEKKEQLKATEQAQTLAAGAPKTSGAKTSQQASDNDITEFIDAYEDKKELNNELKSMDAKAQKGKIQRRQYKAQRSAIETRLEGIQRKIDRTKETFKGTTGGYGDLVKQLDLAEADLAESEEDIKSLESRQSTGEISIEEYKENIGDYQKQRDKAEATINGILLRLREKIR